MIFSYRFFLKKILHMYIYIYIYIHTYGYAFNTYSLPNFLKNLTYVLPYASASTYPLKFPCNITVGKLKIP